MMWRWRNGIVGLPAGRFHRRRHQVVHKRAAVHVARLVVPDLLVQRWCQAHGQATVDLALDHHWIDDRAAVVNSQEPPHLHFTGTAVDVYDGYIRTKWE